MLKQEYNHLVQRLSFSLSPSGVIAAHRITASSPDTDLPTVSGLRVRIFRFFFFIIVVVFLHVN